VTIAILFPGYKLYKFIELVTFRKIAGLPAKTAIFNSQIGDFSIQYPVTWTAGDTPTGARGDHEVIAVISNVVSSPIIEISRISSGTNELGQVTKWGKSKAEEKMGYKLVSLQSYATKNYSGILHEYNRDALSLMGNISFHCIDWFITKNGMGYDFSFCIYQKNWEDGKPVFYQMIDSIKFLNSH